MGGEEVSLWSSADQTLNAQPPTTPVHPGHQTHRVEEWFHLRSSWLHRRKSSTRRRSSLVLERTQTGRRWWKFTLRPWDDDEEQDWWFVGTAIPLIAATVGPLANVFSIAALVTEWRMCVVLGVDKGDAAASCAWNGNITSLGPELSGVSFTDPRWCYDINLVSLIAGFIGNMFLLANFTQRIRYIVALPVTIIMWYIATGLLIGITVSMERYVPPIRPQQTYTQGFWYAVYAACLYMICSMLLMVNMLGYFLGHYPQHFTLTDSQRTLILQTMLFFIWLAGGGAVFSTVERKYGTGAQNFSYVNALYFALVTILTIGYGDVIPTNNITRGLVFPYSVGGIVMLALTANSISRFALELGSDNVIRRHVEHSRARTIGRTVTTSLELQHRQTLQGGRPEISAPQPILDSERQTTIHFGAGKDNPMKSVNHQPRTPFHALRKVASIVVKPPRQRTPKLILLREEKDRFLAMRHIQMDTAKFKRWTSLFISVTAFALLWCVGAVVFWRCERNAQDMTYFEALYFGYVSLLTIGYGDYTPKSNPGRSFFVLWALIAVPTMSILVTQMGNTVVHKFNHGTWALADFTLLPKKGVWREFLDRHPWLLFWLEQRKARRERRQRLEEGFPVGPEAEPPPPTPTIEELAKEEPSRSDLARRLAAKIRQTVDDIKDEPGKRYTYEEWVEFTQLIRFTARNVEDRKTDDADEEEEGLIEWDWIGEDSPMLSKQSESEFVLHRLCESMNRFVKQATAEPLPLPHPSQVAGPLPRRRHGPTQEDDSAKDEISDGDMRWNREIDVDGIDPLDSAGSSKQSDGGPDGKASSEWKSNSEKGNYRKDPG